MLIMSWLVIYADVKSVGSSNNHPNKNGFLLAETYLGYCIYIDQVF